MPTAAEVLTSPEEDGQAMEQLIIIEEVTRGNPHLEEKRNRRRSGFFFFLFAVGVLFMMFSLVAQAWRHGTGRDGSPDAVLAGTPSYENAAPRYRIPPRLAEDLRGAPAAAASKEVAATPLTRPGPERPTGPGKATIAAEDPGPNPQPATQAGQSASLPPEFICPGCETGMFPLEIPPPLEADGSAQGAAEDPVRPQDPSLFAKESLLALHPYRSRYTLQLAVYCRPEAVVAILEKERSNPKFMLVPKQLQGKTCLAILWGIYKTPKEAETAANTAPSFFARKGVKPMVVPVKAYLPS